MIRTAILAAIAISAATSCSQGDPSGPAAARSKESDPRLRVEWPVHGGDSGAQRYSPLQAIQRSNVERLAVAWEWKTGEVQLDSATSTTPRPGRFQATPVMIDDRLFLTTPMNRVIALDANTGQQLWAYDPHVEKMGDLASDRSVLVHRGVAVWSGAEGRRVFLSTRWKLIALDAATGQPIASFGTNGEVDLTKELRWPVDRAHYHNTSPPSVFDDLVIVGSSISDLVTYQRDPPGDVQAFDVRTGRRVWQWETIPRDGEYGADTWESSSSQVAGHANVWSLMTVDTQRGLVYLPVSAGSNDWYGGARKGNNLFSESLVCLDARTGRRVWHFQLVHHGLWDYDPAAAPTLVTLTVANQPVDAVVLPGKTGFLYAFDRVTGRPIWPIEERPVAASDVPNEKASATQPVPAWPRPFARQGFGINDVVDFTPELREIAIEKLRPYRLGSIFTPPSRQGTVVLPGQIGGAGWGAGSYDPETGLFFVKATNRPALARLVPPRHPWEQAEWVMEDETGANRVLDLSFPTRTGLLSWFAEPRRIPIVKPPYGTLTAIDLNTGDHRWQMTLGDTPSVRFHPRLSHLNLPPLGVAGAPGGVATRGGLIFITGGGHVLYAIDLLTGRELWQHDLGSEAVANPMTYRTATGRQFVVIAVGSGSYAKLMAFALSES